MDNPSGRELLARWLLALGCFALLMIVFSPSWAAFALWARVPETGGMLEVRRGVSVLQQIAHPGAPVEDPLHAAIQWRLLFPLVGRVLHLPAWMLFGLAHVGCVAVLGYVAGLVRRVGATWTDVALTLLLIGAADWLFASTGWLGYFDAWLVLGLLLVAFARSSWTVWAACVWAPWVDERFVVALPIALICRVLSAEGDARLRWKREVGVAVALAAVFVTVRMGVLAANTQPGATVRGYFDAIDVGRASWSRILLGLWEGLRGAWLFVGAGVIVLWRRDRAWAAVLTGGTVGLAAIALGTAQDFSRSLMLLVPVAVLGAQLATQARAAWLPRALRVAGFAALLLPAHHVMSDRVNPIYYLHHEWAAFENPPAAAMPEVFELRAIRAMQEGRLAAAETDLTLALKLARNPAPAAKQRGVLRASQGRWKEAAEDFALMARHDPRNPDAWFMCAQSSLALGDVAAAGQHFAHASELAPAEWGTRPDVTRFRTKLVSPQRDK